MRVLIADDSKLIIERLLDSLRMLKQLEIVGVCENGIDALEAIRVLNPDLAIVDNKMPGLSGLEVLSEIRKENKTIKFIILTFYTTDTYRDLALKSGADYFFSKVDDFEKLMQIIKNLLLNEINDKELK